MSADVPNDFIQTAIPTGNSSVIMNIPGFLVDLLLEMDIEVYGNTWCMIM